MTPELTSSEGPRAGRGESRRIMRDDVTLEMVAKKAGVSRSTVSRVVNGALAVSPDAQKRVQQAISELNYVPNRAARSLASKRAGAIALVIPEDTTRFFGDPFFAKVIEGIDRRMRETDYILNLLIASTGDRDKALRYLTGGNADGALVLSHHTSDEFLQILEEYLPVVYGGRPLKGSASQAFVDVENYQGATEATEYLLDCGVSRPACISGPSSMPSGAERLAAFTDVVLSRGLPLLVEEGDFTQRSGAEATERLLLQGVASFDGLFVSSDLMARGAIDVLTKAGLNVPDDVPIVSFDDSPAATQGRPELTTVRQGSEQQGWEMTDMLLRILKGDQVTEPIVLSTELVVRESAISK